MPRGSKLRIAALACALCATALGQRESPDDKPPPPPQPDPRQDPERDLTAEEATRMVELLLIGVDQGVDPARRRSALRLLGEESGHQATIPVFRKLVQDTGQPQDVRAGAVWGLRVTAHKDIVPILIGLLEDEDKQIRLLSDEALAVHFPEAAKQFEFPPDDAAGRAALVRKWREWWEANKDKVKLDRSRAFAQ